MGLFEFVFAVAAGVLAGWIVVKVLGALLKLLVGSARGLKNGIAHAPTHIPTHAAGPQPGPRSTPLPPIVPSPWPAVPHTPAAPTVEPSSSTDGPSPHPSDSQDDWIPRERGDYNAKETHGEYVPPDYYSRH